MTDLTYWERALSAEIGGIIYEENERIGEWTDVQAAHRAADRIVRTYRVRDRRSSIRGRIARAIDWLADRMDPEA